MATNDFLIGWLPGQNDWPNLTAARMNRDANYGFFLEFADATDEAVIFTGIMPTTYAGGGLSVECLFLMATATTGSVMFDAALQNLGNGQDLSGSVVWDVNTVTQAVPGVAETVAKATIAFTNGADMDSVVAGDPFRLYVSRVGSNAADDAAGDLRLLAVNVKEA